jgi:hypothetical protein
MCWTRRRLKSPRVRRFIILVNGIADTRRHAGAAFFEQAWKQKSPAACSRLRAFHRGTAERVLPLSSYLCVSLGNNSPDRFQYTCGSAGAQASAWQVSDLNGAPNVKSDRGFEYFEVHMKNKQDMEDKVWERKCTLRYRNVGV